MRKPSTPRVRLHIDWTRCHGRGLCTELLPRLLTRDDWGYPIVRDGSREPVVPSSLLSEARSAVDLCPRLALSLRADASRQKIDSDQPKQPKEY